MILLTFWLVAAQRLISFCLENIFRFLICDVFGLLNKKYIFYKTISGDLKLGYDSSQYISTFHCKSKRCGTHELRECQTIMDVPLCASFGCSRWRFMAWWRLFLCVEVWATLSGHASFLHPDVIIHHMFDAKEIFIRECV